MVRFRTGIARCRRLPGRVSGLAIAIGLLVAACGPAQTAANSTATAHGTATPSSSASQRPSSAADCATTCYTPQQLEAAYQKVQDIAEKTVEGTSQSKSLADLQKLLIEQSRKSAGEKG